MFRRRKSRPVLSFYVGMHKGELIEDLKECAAKEKTTLEQLTKEDGAYLKAEVMRLLFFKYWLLDGLPPSSKPEDYEDSILELYVIEEGKEQVVLRIPSQS